MVFAGQGPFPESLELAKWAKSDPREVEKTMPKNIKKHKQKNENIENTDLKQVPRIPHGFDVFMFFYGEQTWKLMPKSEPNS